MGLFTAEQRRQLIDNWNPEGDALWPVVKIFSPIGTANWPVASMNPQDEDTEYGLCDLGLGYPELGYMRLSELQSMTVRVPPGSVGIGLEQDLYFSRPTRLSPMRKLHGSTALSLTTSGFWTLPKALAKLPFKRIVEIQQTMF